MNIDYFCYSKIVVRIVFCAPKQQENRVRCHRGSFDQARKKKKKKAKLEVKWKRRQNRITYWEILLLVSDNIHSNQSKHRKLVKFTIELSYSHKKAHKQRLKALQNPGNYGGGVIFDTRDGILHLEWQLSSSAAQVCWHQLVCLSAAHPWGRRRLELLLYPMMN